MAFFICLVCLLIQVFIRKIIFRKRNIAHIEHTAHQVFEFNFTLYNFFADV